MSLQKAGFEVLRDQSVEAGARVSNRVSFQLFRLNTSVSYQGKMTGEIQALVSMKTPRGTFKKTIDGYSSFDRVVAVGSTYQELLELTLEDFVRKSIHWIRDRTSAK